MFEAIVFIVILSVLVLIHELGHYLVAKKNHIKVEEFGIGYPPRALQLFKHQGTIFSINWIPFGGFVRLLGEDGPSEQSTELSKQQADRGTGQDEDRAFYQQSIKARLSTVLAGVFSNFVLAILVFALIFSITGIPRDLQGQPRIATLADQSPAAQANLLVDSNILAFRSDTDQQWVAVNSVEEVQDYVAQHLGETVSIKTSGLCQASSCPTDSFDSRVYLRTDDERPVDEGALGVVFAQQVYQKYPWYLAPLRGIIYGVRQSISLSIMILQSLTGLVSDLWQGRSVADQVAGPVGIVRQAQVYGFFDGGILDILNFAAVLSINLGVINLLPLPALDGGRAVFIVLEKIWDKRKINRWANWANYVGFFILIGLMIVVSANDVLQLF